MLTHRKPGVLFFTNHDGASPHTARANVKQWACHGVKKKFKIEVITQPPQSPDLNVNDLAFFSSLQSDCELVAKETAIELKEAVENCWQEYPADRMAAIWNCLFASLKGIVESKGDNSYSHHTGSRHAHHISAEGAHHDRLFLLQNIKEAEKSLEFLRNEVDAYAECGVDAASSSSDDDE